MQKHRKQKSPNLPLHNNIIRVSRLQHMQRAKPIRRRIYLRLVEAVRVHAEVDDKLNHVDYCQGHHDFERS